MNNIYNKEMPISHASVSQPTKTSLISEIEKEEWKTKRTKIGPVVVSHSDLQGPSRVNSLSEQFQPGMLCLNLSTFATTEV